MKGVLLAGGRATRLRPITHTMTKHLIPLANKPILFYGLEALTQAGIRDIGVVVGCQHPDFPGSIDTRRDIAQAVGDGSRWGARATYIEQDAPRGIAHAVLTARDFVAGDSFVTFLGDNFLPGGILDFVKEFEAQRPDAMILLCRVPNPQDFGVATLEGERVVRLEEKPKEPQSNLALVGVYLFNQTVFPAIERLKPSARGELEITHAIQALIDDGLRVQAHEVRGWWKDTGTLADLLEANRLVLEGLEARHEGEVDAASQILGRVVLEEGSKVENSVVQGPAIIGKKSRIINAIVGPYISIHDNVVIERSEVANSIILAGSVLRGVPQKVRDSLIGQQVVVERDVRDPGFTQLMLGDYSRVTLR